MGLGDLKTEQITGPSQTQPPIGLRCLKIDGETSPVLGKVAIHCNHMPSIVSKAPYYSIGTMDI